MSSGNFVKRHSGKSIRNELCVLSASLLAIHPQCSFFQHHDKLIDAFLNQCRLTPGLKRCLQKKMYKIFVVFGYPDAWTPGCPGARTSGRSDARTPGRPDARTLGRPGVRTAGRSDAYLPLFLNFCGPRGEGPSRAAPARAGPRRHEPGGAGPSRGGRKNCEKRTKNEIWVSPQACKTFQRDQKFGKKPKFFETA